MRDDELTKGLPLANMVAIAISEPGSVLPRQNIRGVGVESMDSWRARAVWQTLYEFGIDSHVTFLTDEDREAAELGERRVRGHGRVFKLSEAGDAG